MDVQHVLWRARERPVGVQEADGFHLDWLARCVAAQSYSDIVAQLLINMLLPGVDIPESERETVSKRLMDEYSCLPVYVSDEIADRHYNGFSNSILWPLFHYRQSPNTGMTS